MNDPMLLPVPSTHTKVLRLAEGVFAVLASPGGDALANAGIIDMGGETLAFDTLGSPAASRELSTLAEQLTGRAPGLVVNSHSHYDHWCGNQVFAGRATIMASRLARAEMVRLLADLQATILDPEPLRRGRAAQLKAGQEASDHRRREAHLHAAARLEKQLHCLIGLEPLLPGLDFEGELVLHGRSRQAVLRSCGVCHSPGDVYLSLPEDGILFLGDLARAGAPPLLVAGEPSGWLDLLDQLSEVGAAQVVFGHGNPGSAEDLRLARDYLSLLEALVVETARTGDPVEAALGQPLPPPFAGWVAAEPLCFEQSVRVLDRSFRG